jgi:hypothetical protein
MQTGKRLTALAVTMAVAVLLSSSPAEADDNQDAPKVAAVTLVPATATDMPVGKATFGPGAGSASISNATASWVCTVYASDIWQDGDWAEGEGSQFCSGTGYSPQMIRTQIQRSRWFGWETLKIDTSSWTSGYMVTLLPGYDCSDDGNHEYRLVTTGWAEGGLYSGEVQSLNYVRFTC